MFRYAIHADGKSDIEDLVAKLEETARQSGVPEVAVMMLTSRTRASLQTLIRRGQDMAGSGSTLNAEQVLQDETYHVRISFGVGKRPTLIERLSAWIRGR